MRDVSKTLPSRTVHSSHGDITCNLDGTIREHTRDSAKQYGCIRRFDFEEYARAYPDEPAPQGYDILDLGYWFAREDGTEGYEEPVATFRAEVREEAKRAGMIFR